MAEIINMKISICSDLHLEFGELDLKNIDNADVLILSGDVCIAKAFVSEAPTNQAKAIQFLKFFKQCSEEFDAVIYIMGNHEHYHGDFAETASILCNALADMPNIHFLDKDTVDIDGVTFFGATLWTDMNDNDPLTMNTIRYAMNDFRCVSNSAAPVTSPYQQVGKWTPEEAYAEHKHTLEKLSKVLENNNKTVVVSHHCPSKKSTKPGYEKDVEMNGGYSSNLEAFIEAHPNIVLWTHGHTHSLWDYTIGNTRIVCNPRGYIGYEPEADNFELKTVEI